MKLKDKVAAITGAANGIGAACARSFVSEGASVIIADVDSKAGEALASELNAKVCDVSSTSDIERALAAAERHFGGLDILVNNAAIQNVKGILETSEEEFKHILDVNLTSVFRGIKASVPYMKRRGGGVIVNTSSTFALVGSPGYAAYHASKGGVSSLTRASAIGLLEHNIRVNAESCGDQNPSDMMQTYLEKQPLGRFGTPHEVASAVLFLASEESRFLVGSNLVVDGGYTIV
eukprot:jgi/Mesen1/7154/ME000037S06511